VPQIASASAAPKRWPLERRLLHRFNF